MKVLIDGDSLVYTIGFASQKNIWQACDDQGVVYFEHESKPQVTAFIEDAEGEYGALDYGRRIEVSPVEHAFHSIKVIIQKIAARAKANSYKIFLTGPGNFREGIATIMGYKHNRLDAEKPALYQEIRDYLVSTHKATVVEGMEADDALSIVHQRAVSGAPVNVSADPNHEVLRYPDECIIAAIDKDLRNIPGKHINFDKRVAENDEYKFIVISEEEGRHTFWKQVLTGDSSDNILGIPGMGPKKADALLDPLLPDPATGKPGGTEADYFRAVYGEYKRIFGTKPFEYFRFDAYTDTTATYRKRELKPESEILPEQRLVGTALTFLLENARLLWMLREAPNAEGTHWWMPPLTFDEIAIEDGEEEWANKELADAEGKPPEGTEPFEPWTEGRGKWFWSDGTNRYGKFGTKKKAQADIADWKAINEPPAEDTQTGDEGTQDGDENLPEHGQESAGTAVTPEDLSPDQNATNVDPVCQKWGFWDETWTTWYGPYESDVDARTALDAYVIQLDGGPHPDPAAGEEKKGVDFKQIEEEVDNETVTGDDLVTEPVPEDDLSGSAERAERADLAASSGGIWDESF